MIARDRLNFGLVEVVYEWARNKVRLLNVRLRNLKLKKKSKNSLVICRNNEADRHPGGYNRPMHTTIERNYARCERCGSNYWQSGVA